MVLENNSFLYNTFFIFPIIKWIIVAIPFDIYFITFFLNYFFYPKFCLICLLQFFYLKCFNNYFSIKVFYYICWWNSLFNFFNHKNFARPSWGIVFYKNVFIFWYSYVITNLKFRNFFIIFYTKINICAWLYINRLHFNGSMICTVLFTYYIIKFISLHILGYWSKISS